MAVLDTSACAAVVLADATALLTAVVVLCGSLCDRDDDDDDAVDDAAGADADPDVAEKDEEDVVTVELRC